MGEVYRARDTKLNRDVALKILPAAWTSDGRIIVVTFSLSASMWRFRPQAATR